ncbi:CoA transferase [Tistrella bauzanensis]|uniref:CoA transferase n=1 Tax=Tistrella bauzanensis TaxID=657419 RepID=A0ABQ1IJ40_9PROT|nr:CoA transferase [Tistrella bauzanensis]GGB41545.1 CoA transferase [Tistrella bauzanensis]
MLPLNGIKVIEIAQNLAGPHAGEILASLGADVIKVERPDGGDDARGWGPPFAGDTAVTFHAMNRNKRGITLDLKDPAGLARLRDLLADADILVQNMRPGMMEQIGLDADSLAALNPRLIYCSLWAFGATGPMRLKPGYEPIIQAFAGIFSVNGTPEGPPSRVGMQVLDLGTGVWAALGCLAALLQRGTTGRGITVDVSLLETAMGWLAIYFAAFKVTGRQPQRHASGNPNVVVFQSLPTSDGEIVVAAANDRLFAKLAREVGRPDWADDPRYATNGLRVANKATLLPELEAIMRTRGKAEWAARLEAVGIPCSPIHSLAEIAADAQLAALDLVARIPDTDLDVVGLPVSLGGERPGIRNRAPRLGEHNDEILGPR